MADPSAPVQGTEREQLRAFVAAALDRYSAYHEHKENMAYAGVVVYTAAAVTALTTSWPPQSWQWQPKWLATAAFTAFWVAVLLYLRFQLRRRRWAALRVAGCDWLLASWLPGAPGQQSPPPESAARGFWARIGAALRKDLSTLPDWLWPQEGSVPVVDVYVHVYPEEIRDAWLAAEERGTEAIRHERLIHVVGWTLYVAVVIRTVAA